ncbi:hypothetical protein [Paraliobacillus sp. X-1268]|uniref:hypothetical protein n=1 Tax=Paraliobacillus sp. X-1268 TaxID=2213193 RepID=UPI000E3BC0FF|nr:hypothetical protein [Paraliobacillus sp. X-1268]
MNDDSTNFSINENFWDFKSDLDNYELQQKYDQNIREFYGEEYSEYADEFIKSANAGDHYFTDHFYQITCEKLCTLESIKWTDFYIQEIDVSIKAEYKNEKVISHGGFWCSVCKDYLERDNVLDPEFGCGRCSTDNWDNARIVVQVVADDND